MEEIRYLALGEVTKTWDVSDGVMFEGRIGGPTLDLDDQFLDKDYLDSAVPKWAASGGNFRVMHQSIAAGKAESVEDRGDSWWTIGKVVDPTECMKLKAGLYNGLSVGIKNGVVVNDKAAKNGRIVGGEIVEVSLVDRPCDPANTLSMKSALAEMTDADVDKINDPDVLKRDFTAADRKEAAKRGTAMPDGSFPIENEEDLHNAVRLAGHAKDPAAAKKHIIQRARAMGLTSALPDDWKADTKKMAFEEIVVLVAEDKELLQLLQKIVAPTKETVMPDETKAASPVVDTPAVEKADVDEDKDGDNDALKAKAQPTAVAAPAASPDGAVGKEATPDISKFVTADSLKAALAETMKASLSEALKPFEDRIAEMEKRAAPGGPVVVRRQFDGSDESLKALLQKRADSLQALVNHPDPRVAQDARYALEKLA